MDYKTDGVKFLVQDVLRSIPEPYGEEITLEVCVKIKSNPEWLRRYGELSDDLRDWVVNNSIGQYVKAETGLNSLGKGSAGKNNIIKTYTKLGAAKMDQTKSIRDAQIKWRWEDGVVDEQKEHIGIRYGNADETSYRDWMPIARIATPKHNVFKVEWLVRQDASEYQTILTDTRRSLNFYLVEKNEPDPWKYALYHCNTSANMYSPVHWSYFPTGHEGKRHASRVVQLSAEEAGTSLGDAGKPGRYIKSG